MKQYAEMKAKHPDAILLFRVGDFYETFSAIKKGTRVAANISSRARGAPTAASAGRLTVGGTRAVRHEARQRGRLRIYRRMNTSTNTVKRPAKSPHPLPDRVDCRIHVTKLANFRHSHNPRRPLSQPALSPCGNSALLILSCARAGRYGTQRFLSFFLKSPMHDYTKNEVPVNHLFQQYVMLKNAIREMGGYEADETID